MSESFEVGGISDSARKGMLTLGVTDHVKTWWPMSMHAAAKEGTGGTPWGVLVRSTNGGEPKIEEGKGT